MRYTAVSTAFLRAVLYYVMGILQVYLVWLTGQNNRFNSLRVQFFQWTR